MDTNREMAAEWERGTIIIWMACVRPHMADLLSDQKSETPEEAGDRKLRQQNVNRAVQNLDEREQKIIIWCFGLDEDPPASVEYVAEQLNISRERVRQLKNRALDRLLLGLQKEKKP